MVSKLFTNGIPKGATAKVSIIDTTFLYDIPVDNYIQPIVPGYETFALPSNLTPEALLEIESDRIQSKVEKDVIEVLNLDGIEGKDIEAVVFSHYYWDHIGDTSNFPNSTDIIVGPGFTEAFIPAYPANANSPILQTDYERVSVVHRISFIARKCGEKLNNPVTIRNHNVQEISFADPNLPVVDAFHGHDYFGDGSFYLVNAPGHSIGHICAIARTTTSELSKDTFVFMGGDACHHSGEFRPSPYNPLPENIYPHPLMADSVHPCPGASWAKYLRGRGRSIETPFFSILDTAMGAAYNHHVKAAKETIKKVQDTDSEEDVLVIIAHDNSIKDIVGFFPLSINDWKAKGWGVCSRWPFLKDFRSVYNNYTE